LANAVSFSRRSSAEVPSTCESSTDLNTHALHLERLRKRGLSTKRSMALREFALGIESLERLVKGEPLRRVHECVFGVLALESEPVDPRL
jgi:protein phosphatase